MEAVFLQRVVAVVGCYVLHLQSAISSLLLQYAHSLSMAGVSEINLVDEQYGISYIELFR